MIIVSVWSVDDYLYLKYLYTSPLSALEIISLFSVIYIYGEIEQHGLLIEFYIFQFQFFQFLYQQKMFVDFCLGHIILSHMIKKNYTQ
jgi:hypothetical protein